MPINLTTPFTLTNGTRLAVSRPRVYEDDNVMRFVLILRTAVGGTPPDSEVSRVSEFEIRNGQCDRVTRGAPSAGGSLGQLLVHDVAVLNKPTGFTDAYAALKTSRAAFEAHLLSAGYLVNLAGT